MIQLVVSICIENFISSFLKVLCHLWLCSEAGPKVEKNVPRCSCAIIILMYSYFSIGNTHTSQISRPSYTKVDDSVVSTQIPIDWVRWNSQAPIYLIFYLTPTLSFTSSFLHLSNLATPRILRRHLISMTSILCLSFVLHTPPFVPPLFHTTSSSHPN